MLRGTLRRPAGTPAKSPGFPGTGLGPGPPWIREAVLRPQRGLGGAPGFRGFLAHTKLDEPLSRSLTMTASLLLNGLGLGRV